MKKNIEYANINSSLLGWLINKLKGSPDDLQGEIYTKEQIYRAVWDDEYLMDDSNIMSFIRKLRKKIEPNPDAPKFILTVWGIGYKFNDK